MRVPRQFGALFIAVALAVACSHRHSVQMTSTENSDDGARVRVSSHSKFASTTELRKLVAEVPDGMKSNLLDFDPLEVEQGVILLKLFAPDGTLKSEQEVRAGGQLESDWLHEPTAGQWRLELDLQAATGSYDIDWRVER